MSLVSLYDEASLWMTPSGAKDGKLFSELPTDGSGDFTFSRGSNLAATRVGPTGLIEKGRENLFLNSNQFDTGWPTSNATFTSGQSGYDGSSDAWLLTSSVAGGRIQLTRSDTGVHTTSAYFKKGSADGVWFRINMGADANIYVNLINGTKINSTGEIATKITDVGNGWYRVELTANWVSVDDVRIYPANTSGVSIAGSIYIQDAQLEIGLAATDYIESGATTGKAGLLEDEPRLDYSGGATCPSLLLEPSRTNLVRQSEYFGDWIQSNTIITSNVAISPEGLQNASELEFTALTAEFYRTFSNVASSDHTGSIFLKNIDKNSVKVQLDGGTPAISGGCDVDLINGTISNEYGSVTAGIADFGNGWYRVHFGDDSNASTANPRFEVTNASTGSTLGSLYVYGAQAEVGSYPTSYIPNHSGGTVTRSRDTGSLNLVGAGINDGWTSGTILIEFEKPYNNENNDVIRIHGNSVSGRAYIYNNGYGFASDWSYSSNFTIGDNTKIIYRLNTLSTANLFKNGVKFTGAEGSGTAWSNIKYIYLNNQVGAKINIKQIVVFPTALTDSECIKLTTL